MTGNPVVSRWTLGRRRDHSLDAGSFQSPERLVAAWRPPEKNEPTHSNETARRGVAHYDSAMSISDEDINEQPAGDGLAPAVGGDADSSDASDSDGTDGDSDGTDAGDSDGTDAGDSDGTDAGDSDGTDA